jgi:hypothetical protein
MAVHALRSSFRARPAPPRGPRHAAWAGVGLVVGAPLGVLLGFLTVGSRLGLPILLGLAGACAGIAAGVLVADYRARRPAPDPPPAAPTEPPPAPHVLLEPPADAPAIPAWLPDPQDPERRRMWDGEAWTSHVWRARS